MPTSSLPVTEGDGDSQSQPQAVTPGAAHGPSLWGELGSESKQPSEEKAGCSQQQVPRARATGTMDGVVIYCIVPNTGHSPPSQLHRHPNVTVTK